MIFRLQYIHNKKREIKDMKKNQKSLSVISGGILYISGLGLNCEEIKIPDDPNWMYSTSTVETIPSTVETTTNTTIETTSSTSNSTTTSSSTEPEPEPLPPTPEVTLDPLMQEYAEKSNTPLSELPTNIPEIDALNAMIDATVTNYNMKMAIQQLLRSRIDSNPYVISSITNITQAHVDAAVDFYTNVIQPVVDDAITGNASAYINWHIEYGYMDPITEDMRQLCEYALAIFESTYFESATGVNGNSRQIIPNYGDYSSSYDYYSQYPLRMVGDYLIKRAQTLVEPMYVNAVTMGLANACGKAGGKSAASSFFYCIPTNRPDDFAMYDDISVRAIEELKSNPLKTLLTPEERNRLIAEAIGGRIKAYSSQNGNVVTVIQKDDATIEQVVERNLTALIDQKIASGEFVYLPQGDGSCQILDTTQSLLYYFEELVCNKL